jgi:hypothetical protein
MFKFLKCFLFGHKLTLISTTTQNLIAFGRQYASRNLILRRCELCGKYKEYKTKAYYSDLNK